jgi:hypothetical protein
LIDLKHNLNTVHSSVSTIGGKQWSAL